jgi:putative hydrolase of the HAD superfamily
MAVSALLALLSFSAAHEGRGKGSPGCLFLPERAGSCAWQDRPVRPPPPAAVLLDAFGTLVTFDDPAPRLRAEVLARTGADVGAEAARVAMGAEIAYYRDHHEEGVDADAVAGLRRRCGAVVAASLGGAVGEEQATEALLAAIEWRAFVEVPGVLGSLRARGIRLAVVSNWDTALPEVLSRLGLLPFFAAVLASAPERCSKPAPEIFARALARLGVRPEETVHVGDSEEHDVAGARAAGVEPVLLRRTGGSPSASGARTIATLAELEGLWR